MQTKEQVEELNRVLQELFGSPPTKEEAERAKERLQALREEDDKEEAERAKERLQALREEDEE